MRAQGLVTYARGRSKTSCFHDEKYFFKSLEISRSKRLFFHYEFKFYLEQTLMRNEAPGNLRVNLRTLLKRTYYKTQYLFKEKQAARARGIQ